MKKTLRYQTPARQWVEALPLGNGRIGAMAYGGVDEDLFCMNEDTLWSGTLRDSNVPGSFVYFRQARELALNCRYKEAEQILQDHFCGDFTEAYLPLGNIHVRLFPEGSDAAQYSRELSLRDAIHTTQYRKGESSCRCTSFVSRPRQAFYAQYTGSKRQSLSCRISMTSLLRHTITVAKDCLVMDLLCPSHAEPSYEKSPAPIVYETGAREGIRARAILYVRQTQGLTHAENGTLWVENADSIEVIFCVRSNFARWDIAPANSTVPYRENVMADFGSGAGGLVYSSARRTRLGIPNVFRPSAAYHRRRRNICLVPNGRTFASRQNDAGLMTLLFDYGRYLMICGSRPGTQPLNLQGIWNDSVTPPWSANYTLNINTEMNYWPALVCNLAEMQQPLTEMMLKLQSAGRAAAAAYYDARGFVAHHNTDLWRHANPVGHHKKGCCKYGFWPLSTGWLCRHLYEQYEYTNNVAFLRDTVYPILHEACLFYLDVMSTDENGRRIFAPSTSPENNFLLNGEPTGVAKTTTMTVSILRELFTNCIQCCKTLQTDAAFMLLLQRELAQMPDLPIGADGRLLEWSEERPEQTPVHRHLSHLYGLYPGREISVRRTKQLAQACEKTLIMRTDEGTGWSLAWKVNLWARLGNGNRALELLKRQLHPADTSDMGCRFSGGGTYPNMLDAHPPFQIDGNFGACAGIAEMLLQNDADELLLLPALPDAWQNGSVSGLRAKHDIEVSMAWKNGALTKAVFITGSAQTQKVRYRDAVYPVMLKPGKTTLNECSLRDLSHALRGQM